ncbi:MAG: zinc dependent phospholipase C family protein [Clostridia bacterium]|nr:zinc dependent phospholipase C family protein [Clostridia bacterium]
MPDYFAHKICAQKILESCSREVKNKINDHTLYLLGAQGGDVFFAYKLNFSMANLGRRLNRVHVEELFENLITGNTSYAAGFATHYALDCTLHPAIYAFESNAKAPLAHVRFENDLGLYISKKFAVPRNILPREHVLSATFAIYDSISKIEPRVTVTGVERCLKRHFTYTRTLLKNKKQEFSFNYDYRSLSGAVDDALSLGAECVKAVISGDISGGLFSKSFLEK